MNNNTLLFLRYIDRLQCYFNNMKAIKLHCLKYALVSIYDWSEGWDDEAQDEMLMISGHIF